LPTPGAIISAAKAARQVNSSGNVTTQGISPLVASYDGWGAVYGQQLPRPARDFTEGAFGPLTPIPPMPVDQPPPGFDRPMPRRWQYPFGWNLPTGMPRTEGVTLTDFGTLRSLGTLYSVARACIQLLKSEIRGLEWDIVPTKDAAKAMRGDHKAMKDFGERRAKAIRFFKNPDPEYGSWSSWIDTLLEDVYVIDALSVYLRPSRVRGRGLMGSDLSALELIDGSTLRPLVDLHGSRPSPPSPALEQYLWGIPRTDTMSILMGADLDEDTKKAKVQEYRGDQLLYLPYTRQTRSPYGMPPIEQALVPVMSGLSKQGWQLDFYREGSVPAAYISPGDAAMTPSQIRELQEALNVIAGDVGFKHKIIVLPPGSKTMPQKPPELADQFDQVVSVEVCMAFQVQPTELGLMPQVATVQSPSAVNQVAKANSATHQRKSLVPMLQWLKQSLLDKVIQEAAGQPDMQFMFAGLEEDEDEVALTNMLVAQIGGGLASVDEARADIGRDPWGLPVTQDPLWASANGVMLLGSVDPVTGQPAGQPAALPSPGTMMGQPGGQQPSPGGNEGQVNPSGAMAQGHMPGTTHVPPARQRDQTPSHSAAISGAAEAAAHVAGSSGKAALSELDALARHVRKGRDPATWQPVHIPGSVMAMITEDVTKGLDVATVLTAAREFLPKAEAAKSGSPRAAWQAWEHDLKLAEKYQVQVSAAFAAVMKEAAALFAAFLAGTLAVTAAVLASMIADLIRKRLAMILGPLHAEGRELGRAAAMTATGATARQRQAIAEARQADMAQIAQQAAVRQMSGTGLAAFTAALVKALLAGGATVGVLLALLAEFLNAENRAALIALTEIEKAIADGAYGVYKLLGVGWLNWVSVPDSRRCAKCAQNTAASPQPLGTIWPGTLTESPPGHPMCRCAITPGQAPKQGAAPPVPGTAKAAGKRPVTDQHSSPGNGLALRGSHLVRGAPPAGDVTKADKPWKKPDTSKSPGEQVYAQLLEDYPASALGWVKDAKWSGPQEVPLSAIEYQPGKWQAGHEDAKVERFKAKIKRRQAAGKPVKPAVLIDAPDTESNSHLIVVDGHHRTIAFHGLKRPVVAYVGKVTTAGARAAEETHASQFSDRKLGAGDDGRTTKNFTAGNLGDGSVYGLVPFDLRGQDDDDEEDGEAAKAARGYSLNKRSGMISLDLPEGLIEPVPGGVSDFHVTIAYLGPDVDDETFEAACHAAKAAAAQSPPPSGTIGGRGTFPEGDDGIPVWAEVDVPLAHALHAALGWLQSPESAVARSGKYTPHMTRAYLAEGDPLPEPLPDVPVTFTHLSVHRGDDVQQFPFGGIVKSGDAETLREYWTHEAHPGPTNFEFADEVAWGTDGDFNRCTALVMEHGHMSEEQAHGYCNLLHHRALGYWPAQHARMDRDG
jgi:2'-5' RNA ligase